MDTKELPLLVGPSLKTLSPDLLEELVRLVKPEMIDALDENDGDWNELGDEGRSLHPKFKFVYSTKDDCDEETGIERIEFWEWVEGMTDCGMESDTRRWAILVGEVHGPFSDCWEVLPVVKWFLDHGWNWRT